MDLLSPIRTHVTMHMTGGLIPSAATTRPTSEPTMVKGSPRGHWHACMH